MLSLRESRDLEKAVRRAFYARRLASLSVDAPRSEADHVGSAEGTTKAESEEQKYGEIEKIKEHKEKENLNPGVFSDHQSASLGVAASTTEEEERIGDGSVADHGQANGTVEESTKIEVPVDAVTVIHAHHGEANGTVEETTKIDAFSALILDERIKEIDKSLIEMKSRLARVLSRFAGGSFLSVSTTEKEGPIGIVISDSVKGHGEANGTTEEIEVPIDAVIPPHHGEAYGTVEETTKMEALSPVILDELIKEVEKLLIEMKSVLAGGRSRCSGGSFVSASTTEEEGSMSASTVEETTKIEALSALNSYGRKKVDEVLIGAVIPGHGAVEEMTTMEGSSAELVEEHTRDGDDTLEGGEEEIKDKKEVTDEVEGDESSDDHDLDEEEDYGHLCTITCDFLCDLEPLPSKSWDREISGKVLSGFRKCYKDDSSELGKDTIVIDIRGRYVIDALEAMMMHLYSWSRQPEFKTLLVTVGCKVHGCGERNLYWAVTNVLQRDESIHFTELHNGAVISIPLNGREDYSSLGYPLELLF